MTSSADGKRRYTIIETYDDAGGRYSILELKKGAPFPGGPVVWQRQIRDGDDQDENEPYPADVRAEYERLLGRGEFLPDGAPEPEAFVNVVEAISDQEENAWDQPCAHGFRVDGHAVYCHNERWLYSPRKCRRTQGPSVWGEPWPHEQCRGFKPNSRTVKDKPK